MDYKTFKSCVISTLTIIYAHTTNYKNSPMNEMQIKNRGYNKFIDIHASRCNCEFYIGKGKV